MDESDKEANLLMAGGCGRRVGFRGRHVFFGKKVVEALRACSGGDQLLIMFVVFTDAMMYC